MAIVNRIPRAFFPPLTEPSPLDPDLVFHYKLNDNVVGSGLVINNGTGIDGALVNQADSTLYTSGVTSLGLIDKCFDFKGDTLSYPNPARVKIIQDISSLFQSSFSISGWVNLRDGQVANGIRYHIFDFGGGGGGNNIGSMQASITPTTGELYVYYRSAVDSSNRIQYGTNTGYIFPNGLTGWIHIAIRFQEAGLEVYVNNVHRITFTKATVGSGATLADFNGFHFSFGGAYGGYSLNGFIDDFRIYSKFLDLTEISDLYNGGAGTES